jgi:hypothetical protein
MGVKTGLKRVFLGLKRGYLGCFGVFLTPLSGRSGRGFRSGKPKEFEGFVS